ncbi:hypothetical protein Ancab_011202, partial [Ancistrocladus abbreviatus]
MSKPLAIITNIINDQRLHITTNKCLIDVGGSQLMATVSGFPVLLLIGGRSLKPIGMQSTSDGQSLGAANGDSSMCNQLSWF